MFQIIANNLQQHHVGMIIFWMMLFNILIQGIIASLEYKLLPRIEVSEKMMEKSFGFDKLHISMQGAFEFVIFMVIFSLRYYHGEFILRFQNTFGVYLVICLFLLLGLFCMISVVMVVLVIVEIVMTNLITDSGLPKNFVEAIFDDDESKQEDKKEGKAVGIGMLVKLVLAILTFFNFMVIFLAMWTLH
ncbi:hypothetical protein [Ligilactobacillus hayakitensis]|nr:hypothetical protein [Ligilactobacillus hayakitensis]